MQVTDPIQMELINDLFKSKKKITKKDRQGLLDLWEVAKETRAAYAKGQEAFGLEFARLTNKK